MNSYIVKSPILFLIFNRPKETLRVFDIISLVKPKVLFISADGPRNNVEGEKIKCELARDIVNRIDWNCELHLNFYSENLGCKNAVSNGISWFFNNVEKGIILEDDCLPNIDFFRFCDELLVKYIDDFRIGHICGCNFQDGNLRGDSDYYYSKLTHVWGWASWKRVWNNYDVNLNLLETAILQDSLHVLTNNLKHKKILYGILKKIKDGKLNTWDYQYFFSNILNGYISIIPNVNLISNIGYGEDATHTINYENTRSNLPTQPLNENISHPSIFIQNREADIFTLNKELNRKFVNRIKTRLKIISSKSNFLFL